MSTEPIPPGALTVLNDTPSLVTKSLARSQSVNFDHGPTKMWKLQVAGSAVTVIGFFGLERLEVRIDVVRQRAEQREVGDRRDQRSPPG